MQGHDHHFSRLRPGLSFLLRLVGADSSAQSRPRAKEMEKTIKRRNLWRAGAVLMGVLSLWSIAGDGTRYVAHDLVKEHGDENK